MIGVDTNVLLRYLRADDGPQHERAKAFIAARSPDDPVFVSCLNVVEVVWVLRRGYKVPSAEIARAFQSMLACEVFVFEDHDFLNGLVRDGDLPGADVADHLIARRAALEGCERTVTFDADAVRVIPSMDLIP